MTEKDIKANDIFYYYDSASGLCRANACPPEERKEFLAGRYGEQRMKDFKTFQECESDRQITLSVVPMSHICSNEGMCGVVQRACEEGEVNCYPTEDLCKTSCKKMHGWECTGNRHSPYYLVDDDRSAFDCNPTMDAPGSRLGVYSSRKECEAMCSDEILSQTAILHGEVSIIHTTGWAPGVL